MPSRWLPEDPVMVISTDCGRLEHGKCETGHCGCTCHLSNLSEPRDY